MRFVIPQINQDSGRPQGVFATAYVLLESLNLSDEEHQQLRELLDWFKTNLPIPKSVEITRRAIFWYRATSKARPCIQRMWQLANILRSHGYVAELQTCRKLCNVRYSDNYQIAAFPHALDAPVITKTI